MTFYPEKYCPDDGHPGAEAALRHHMRGQILRHLAQIEAVATGPFFAGDAPTCIDVYLAPLLRWCALYPRGDTAWFDTGAFPALMQLCRALEARPAIRRACTSEGMDQRPFSAPLTPRPPEGSAT